MLMSDDLHDAEPYPDDGDPGEPLSGEWCGSCTSPIEWCECEPDTQPDDPWCLQCEEPEEACTCAEPAIVPFYELVEAVDFAADVVRRHETITVRDGLL